MKARQLQPMDGTFKFMVKASRSFGGRKPPLLKKHPFPEMAGSVPGSGGLASAAIAQLVEHALRKVTSVIMEAFLVRV